MYYQLFLVIHVFVAIFIIALVLIQQGKGAAMGAAFGSGASQTIFGSRGSGSFLLKLTIGLAVVFFITSLVLNNIVTQAMKQERTQQIELPVPVQQNKNASTNAGSTVQQNQNPSSNDHPNQKKNPGSNDQPNQNKNSSSTVQPNDPANKNTNKNINETGTPKPKKP